MSAKSGKRTSAAGPRSVRGAPILVVHLWLPVTQKADLICRHVRRARNFYLGPLEPAFRRTISPPPDGDPGPAGTRGRRLSPARLMPKLLYGGFGYEDFRSDPLSPVDSRL